MQQENKRAFCTGLLEEHVFAFKKPSNVARINIPNDSCILTLTMELALAIETW